MTGCFAPNRRMILSGFGGFAVGAMLAPSQIQAGMLEPPGPPEPTMLPLSDIEPRTAINEVNTPGNESALFVISEPGSYYLAANFSIPVDKVGILIDADDVTVDLMGFTITGNSSLLEGIVAGFGGRSGIVVRNGSIRWNPLSGTAVDLARDGGHASRIENLQIGRCGVGIRVGPGSMVLDCEVVMQTHSGIEAGDGSIVAGCRAQKLPFDLVPKGITLGAGALVTQSSTEGSFERGVETGEASIIRDCMVGSSGGVAFSAGDGCLVSGCMAASYHRDGLVLRNESLARDIVLWHRNYDDQHTCNVRIEGSRNVLADNTVSPSPAVSSIPLEAMGSCNLIVRNHFRGLTFISSLPVLAADNAWSILPGLETGPGDLTVFDTNPDANLRT